MMSVEESRAAWSPETEHDRELVRQELTSILESPHFSNSKRYPALLVYVVETTLTGHSDRIKERNLGVEVFHRPPDYDTNSDTVVRYTAGEVRKRLALYYHEKNGSSEVQIVLPTGSYVPEFYRATTATENPLPLAVATTTIAPENQPSPVLPLPTPVAFAKHRSFILPAFIAAAIAVACALFFWNRATHRQDALDRFWAPVLSERGSPALISSGSSVFAPERRSGTATADKNNEYPFVSMQLVSSIARLSGLIERRGAEYQVVAAASSTISEMRERPVILVGGYNNPWTLRLLTPLRFSFSLPEDTASIIDREHPDVHWARDRSLPYSSADDYAILGRFRDPTTDSPVVFAAGLGRNGTEAAALFVTSPHYMKLLEDQVGHSFANKNIEVVLKVTVVDGKTGAPAIQAIHVW